MAYSFRKYKNPRDTIGINNNPDKREFRNEEDFTKWCIYVFIPHYYGTRDLKDLRLYFSTDYDGNPRYIIIPEMLYQAIKEIYLASYFSEGLEDPDDPDIPIEILDKIRDHFFIENE